MLGIKNYELRISRKGVVSVVVPLFSRRGPVMVAFMTRRKTAAQPTKEVASKKTKEEWEKYFLIRA